MITSRTYTVGGSGKAHRLDNLTLPWVDVSPSNSYPDLSSRILFDVETDPLNGDKVFAVGEGNSAGGTFGIYISLDAGVTWYIPGGNYQTNTSVADDIRWYEVSVLDSNNIFVSGDNGYVAISNDGGVTFTLTTQLPILPTCPICPAIIPKVLSIHFVTPLVGVVGTDAHAAMTADGGITWAILNSGNIITGPPNGEVFLCTGIHISADQQTIVVLSAKNIFQSLDGGITWTNVYQWAARNGYHLTWTNDLELWGFGLKGERIKSIDGGTTWSVLAGYSISGLDQYAGHFYFMQDGFYSENQNILTTNNGAASGVISELSGFTILAVWTWYQNTQCYVLTDCDQEISPLLVANDFSLNIGQTVRLCPADYPQLTACKCFTISLAPGCDGAFYLRTEGTIYDDCETCPVQCYYLVDCTNPANFIVTSDDFSQYLGKVVHLSECPDICWQIFLSPSCDNPVCVSDVIEVFDTCTLCLPPPPEVEPVDLHPRRIKPGYYTPGCSPAYTEKVSCTYGNQIYQQMVARRYGLTICCQEDAQKWIIKKALLDLRSIYDPELCKCLSLICCPPTCVQVTLQVFNPRTCMPPTNASSLINTSLATCPAPESILFSGIIILP